MWRRLLERCGPFFYRYRKYLLPAVLLLGLFGFTPLVPRGSARLDTILDLCGLAVCLAGAALRAVTIGYAYVRRGGKDGKAYADELVTAGLFAHSRNPLYLGNLLILLGLLIIINSPVAYLFAVPSLLFFYSSIVASEEAYLRGRFGTQFEDYCRRVPRWIPDFRGLSISIAGMRFNWRRLVRKEYGSAFSWIAIAIILRVWEVRTLPAYAAQRAYVAWYWVPFVMALAACLAAKFMKRKRMLTDRAHYRAMRGSH